MIHQRATAFTLGFVRSCIFAIWLVVVLGHPLSPLAKLPSSAFEAFGVLRILPASRWPSLLSGPVLQGLDVLLPALLVLLILGVKPYRLLALSGAVLLTFHQGIIRGFSFINHAELALLLVTYVLVLFPAADGFSWPKRRVDGALAPLYRAALLLMAACVLLAYTSIGAHRLTAGPDLFMGEGIFHYIEFNTFRANAYGFQAGRWVLESPLIRTAARFAFPVLTLFELLALVCLISNRFRYVWLAVMVGFHVSTLFLMNIFFWENLLLLSLLVIDITPFLERLRETAAQFKGSLAVSGD